MSSTSKAKPDDTMSKWIEGAKQFHGKGNKLVYGEIEFDKEETFKKFCKRCQDAGLTVLTSWADGDYPRLIYILSMMSNRTMEICPVALEVDTQEQMMDEVTSAANGMPTANKCFFTVALESKNVAEMVKTVVLLKKRYGARFMSSRLPDIPATPTKDVLPQSWIISIANQYAHSDVKKKPHERLKFADQGKQYTGKVEADMKSAMKTLVEKNLPTAEQMKEAEEANKDQPL